MKEKILDIAIQQMKSGGYRNLSFAAIATELRTSRANLHYHFKNKEGLALAATERYIREEGAALDAIFRVHDGDIVAILGKIEDYLIQFSLTNDTFSACICSQLLHESEVPEKLRQLALRRFWEEGRTLQEQIEKCKQNGSLEKFRDVESLTFRILAAMHGVGQIALIEQDRALFAKQVKGVLVSLVR